MSAPTFGDRVTFGAIVGRRRRFRAAHYGESEDSYATLDLGHGRRPFAHAFPGQYRDGDPFPNLELEVVCDVGRFRRPSSTLVDLVRVPVSATPGHTEERPVGVVIGSTRRHAGVVDDGYEAGRTWTTHATLAVVTVALETDGPAEVFDVLERDLEVLT